MSAFPETLSRIRIAHELSQVRLSVLAELDHSYVSRLEAGGRHPSRACVERLVAAMNATEAERSALMTSAGYMADLALDGCLLELNEVLSDPGWTETEREDMRAVVRAVTKLMSGRPHVVALRRAVDERAERNLSQLWSGDFVGRDSSGKADAARCRASAKRQRTAAGWPGGVSVQGDASGTGRAALGESFFHVQRCEGLETAMTNERTAAIMGDPSARHLAYQQDVERVERELAEHQKERAADPDWRAPYVQGVKAELVRAKPEPPSPLDRDAQARSMREAGYALGDICTMQGRALADVAAALRQDANE